MDPPFQLDRRQFICAAAAAVAVPDGARTITTSLPILWSRHHGEGRDIVFIHGWSMDHRDEYRTYEPIFKSRSGWRRHYLDLPGMGASPTDTRIINLDDMLEILLRWIGLTLADRPFAIAGTSIGALLARGVLAHLDNRVQGVLLRAPVVVPETNKRDVDPVTPIYRDAAVMDALSDAERQELGEVLIQTPEYLVALQAKMREAVIPATAAADKAFLASIRDDPRRYRLSTNLDAGPPFARPSLIVAGRHDNSVGFKDATRLPPRFARSTFVILDRAEHGLPIDQQPIFESLVIDWLDRMVEHSTHLDS